MLLLEFSVKTHDLSEEIDEIIESNVGIVETEKASEAYLNIEQFKCDSPVRVFSII